MLLPVISQRLVELAIFFCRDVVGIPRPNRLSLLLRFVSSLFLCVLILTDILDLRLLTAFSFFFVFFLLFFFLIVRNLFILLLLNQQLNRVTDKLTVLLYDLLDLFLLTHFSLILFHVKDNLSAPAELLPLAVKGDGEGSSRRGLPDVLLVIVVFRSHGNFVGHEVSRVETHSELTDHADVSSSR